MMIRFAGVDAWLGPLRLCNPKGFVSVMPTSQPKVARNIYFRWGLCRHSAGRADTGPDRAPKTGYMIESMVSAAVRNIHGRYREQYEEGNRDVECDLSGGHGRLQDGVRGPAPRWPRKRAWAKKGKWSTLAKIALEKYFLMKMNGRQRPSSRRRFSMSLGFTGKRE